MPDVSTGYVPGPGGFYLAADRSGPYSIDSAGNATLIGAPSAGVATVNTLAAAGAAKQLPAAASGGSSANTPLTTTTRRISMRATGSAIRYAIGTGGQTASASSHLIGQDERLDLAVPANAQIAVLSATTTAGVLEVTELV